MRTLLQDLRYALRLLLKNPGFTLVAVLTLALGIGANAAIFSVVHGVLLQRLPFPNADRLVQLQEAVGPEQSNPVSYPNFLDWKAQNHVFAQMAAYGDAEYIVNVSEKSERVLGEIVTEGYFPVLGVQAALGRTFLPEENQTPMARAVAMISYGLWQRVYGSDPQIIGKRIRLNNFDYAIVGVAPRGFNGFSDSAEAWIPFMMRDAAWPEVAKFDFLHSRDVHFVKVLGRLHPGASIPSATTEMASIAANLQRAFPI